jgi:hypothetical protein
MSKTKTVSPDDMTDPLADDSLLGPEEDLLEVDNNEYVLEAEEEEDMEAGRYPAVCVDFENGKSKSGNGQFTLKFQIVGGRKMTAWLSQTPQARWKLVKDLAAFDIAPVDGKIAIKRDLLIGKYVYLEVKPNTYNGRTSMRVEEILKMPEEDISKYSDTPDL